MTTWAVHGAAGSSSATDVPRKSFSAAEPLHLVCSDALGPLFLDRGNARPGGAPHRPPALGAAHNPRSFIRRVRVAPHVPESLQVVDKRLHRLLGHVSAGREIVQM